MQIGRVRIKTRWATLALVGLAGYGGSFPVLFDSNGHMVKTRTGPDHALVSHRVGEDGAEGALAVGMLIVGGIGAASGIAMAKSDPAPPPPQGRESEDPDVEV